MLKNEKRKRDQTTRKFLKNIPGKWLSNASQEDAVKIKRTFPQMLEGVPRASAPWSSADLIRDGIVGLYIEEKNSA